MCCCGGGMHGEGMDHGRMGHLSHAPQHTEALHRQDPETILKTRLARGEITVEEYRQLLQEIRGAVP